MITREYHAPHTAYDRLEAASLDNGNLGNENDRVAKQLIGGVMGTSTYHVENATVIINTEGNVSITALEQGEVQIAKIALERLVQLPLTLAKRKAEAVVA